MVVLEKGEAQEIRGTTSGDREIRGPTSDNEEMQEYGTLALVLFVVPLSQGHVSDDAEEVRAQLSDTEHPQSFQKMRKRARDHQTLTCFSRNSEEFAEAVEIMLQLGIMNQYHSKDILLPPLPSVTDCFQSTTHNHRKRKAEPYLINVVDFESSHFRAPDQPNLQGPNAIAPTFQEESVAKSCHLLARPAAVCDIVAIVREKQPDCLFLSENKLQVMPLLNGLDVWGFPNKVIVPVDGMSGGVCFAWKLGINVEPIHEYKNVM
ncbi:hypothetical protein L484_000656 [Morus notabilis]|uniref:Uncharacterized protein n=1 Tax=Morus notabilis TaxID=981085 RepID=W9SMD9_9ROSA|nr:hypothetical protein L484_000656 [Morus notabilis]